MVWTICSALSRSEPATNKHGEVVPASAQLVCPAPSLNLVNTLIAAIGASGATPFVPAAMPATCVPCPQTGPKPVAPATHGAAAPVPPASSTPPGQVLCA